MTSMNTEKCAAPALPSLARLLASFYDLMSCHTRFPNTELAVAVSGHLAMLARHTDCKSDLLRKSGIRLSRQWISSDQLTITRLQGTATSKIRSSFH